MEREGERKGKIKVKGFKEVKKKEMQTAHKKENDLGLGIGGEFVTIEFVENNVILKPVS